METKGRNYDTVKSRKPKKTDDAKRAKGRGIQTNEFPSSVEIHAAKLSVAYDILVLFAFEKILCMFTI